MPSGHRERSRSSSPEGPPRGVQEITEKDFFLKNDEFRLWLKDEKDKVTYGVCPIAMIVNNLPSISLNSAVTKLGGKVSNRAKIAKLLTKDQLLSQVRKELE
jgi:hypothetical protein